MFTVLDVSRWQGRIDWDTVKSQRQGPRRDAARTGQQERHALHRPHV